MKTLVLKISVTVIGLSLLNACGYMPNLSKVLPDKKSEYKKSESLPDLEIPPDLTADAINDSMAIPNEAPATLSRYKNPRASSAAPSNTGITETDELWLSLTGSTAELWPKLREFFSSRNYSIELDDEELGVLETGWSEASAESGSANRYKYKIFSEPGEEHGVTVLYINHERQARFADSEEWVDQDRDLEVEGRLVTDLNLFFGVDQVASSLAQGDNEPLPADETQKLEVVDIGDGKLYLAIPEEFTQAWKHTGVALQNAGLQIANKDVTKGLYHINYFSNEPRKKGVLSKLAFWKDDKPKETPYQLSLTGAGSKTELIVLNENGDWETGEEASRILRLIQGRYSTN